MLVFSHFLYLSHFDMYLVGWGCFGLGGVRGRESGGGGREGGGEGAEGGSS